ncbi:hypothetical protein GTW25_06545 [Aliihoeflea aestuarii]|jgi:hypothetical protein|uniref:PRC-barrel domain-containing protein n=1 Tax=Aliihoeflea aestuarii TaxID=453840 RepID=UPI002093D382|nr:PRC-barrel domain-containing protein [Aliihoeflea aestuarii]MCO6390686.1 hypothetical protein [Aliihoeflea aestuarii]
MFAKKLSIALVASGLLAGTAIAQTAWVEIENDNVQVTEFGASVDQVEDWDVFAGGAKIGEVEEVVGTDAATPTALVVDFDGSGGFADQDLVIPLDQFAWENNQLVLNADAATVGSFEVWDD